MKKSLLNVLLLCISLFLIISCEEMYSPDVDISQNELLVVEGKISNEGGVKVKLTKAIGFTSNEKDYDLSENAEKGAIITISDNEGNNVTLTETSNGYYISDYFPGFIGRTYKLYIKTQDGNEYESEPETILPSSDNITLTAEYGNKDVLYTKVNGETEVINIRGANIFVDVSTSEKEKAYYKFNTRKVLETKYMFYPYGRGNGNPCWMRYCLTPEELNLLPNITEARMNNGTCEIKYLNLGFIKEARYNEDASTSTQDAPISIGWLLSCTVSSISHREYLYFEKLRDQLNAPSKIFDPLPTQLNSNIKCINDSKKVVVGFFSVSSEYTVDYFVKCNQGEYCVKYHSINSLPKDISNNCVDSFPPDFWVVD